MKKIFNFLAICLCGLSLCVTSVFAYNKGRWSPEEDKKLKNGVSQFGVKSWKEISEIFVITRDPRQCREHWHNHLKTINTDPRWSSEEDANLENGVSQYGENSWVNISEEFVTTRSPKQCRERWYNHLKARNTSPWSRHEDKLILEFHKKWGNKWAAIAKFLDGRDSNSVKNRYNSTLKDKNNILECEKTYWDYVDDDRLIELHSKYGDNWREISHYFPDRYEESIKERFKSITNYNHCMDYIEDIQWKKIEVHPYCFRFATNAIVNAEESDSDGFKASDIEDKDTEDVEYNATKSTSGKTNIPGEHETVSFKPLPKWF